MRPVDSRTDGVGARLIGVAVFLVVVAGSLGLPALRWNLPQSLGGALVVCVLTAGLRPVNPVAFVAALFFAINAVLSPLVFLLLEDASWQLPQVYFLPSIVVYLIVLWRAPALRTHVGWLSRGTFDRGTVVLAVVLVVVSVAALVVWTRVTAPDLDAYRRFMPEVAPAVLVFYGVAFAFANSLFEEFVARAVMLDGFRALFQRWLPAIAAQALIFAAWHFNGFPGGWSGAALVFVWSLVLGLLRRTSGGMLAPFVAHVFADATIALILLFTVALA